MARFNQTVQTPITRTTNRAGGEAYSQSAELELVSLLLTSFASDQFYRTAGESIARLKELIGKCDPKFAAQAILYARTQFGMRTISHVAASELGKYTNSAKWGKDFYDNIVVRPDDMTEIIAYHKQFNGKIPNAMKKGFCKAFDRFDKYQLAKYRGENKSIKLIDVVRIVHPVPCEKNAAAIKALVAGDLKAVDTWEAKMTKAGQTATNEEEKVELKKNVWIEMINTRKLGYFALVKNLRNIIEQAPEAVDAACDMLCDAKLIKNSLVLPFRFLAASDEIKKMTSNASVRKVLAAISKALDISAENVPVFEGETLVVLDVSGSMTHNANTLGNKSPHIIGGLFAAMIAKKNNSDFMTFDGSARYISYNPLDTITSIVSRISFNGGSTNFHTIFKTANKKYDRVIILSDMQGWVQARAANGPFAEYKRKFNVTPYLYSFDLQNYGSMQFPENNVFCVAGFSDKIFDIMQLLEQDKKALINEIKKVKL